VYDALARRTKTVYPNNLSKESIYDAAGRLVGEKDFAGRETQFEYDALGHLTKVTKFLNTTPVTASFAYDEVGNKLSQIDANGNTTTWSYDSLGRMFMITRLAIWLVTRILTVKRRRLAMIQIMISCFRSIMP
jgi:YD repeat-containing protein